MMYSSTRHRLVALLAVAVWLLAAPAGAQSQASEPIESMPIHVGPLGLRPSVAITNLGRDTNVFNHAENPQADFTATIVPRLVARVRGGRLLLSYGSATEMVYFKKFKSERSVNVTSDVRLDAELGRIRPYVSAGWTSTKERLNSEIDVRAPRSQRTLASGARLQFTSRTAFVVNVRRFEMNFDDGVQFRGVDLSRALNSRTDTLDSGLQVLLTPMTTFSLMSSVQRDRFDAAPERDADTFRVLPSLQFDPTSLIRGTLAVGYRRFRTLRADVPDFSGVTAQATIGYTLLDRTKFDVDIARDVQYSYEDLEPYYLSTGGRLTVTQQVIGRLDVQGFAGRQTMAYRHRGLDSESRHDRAETFGGGTGYRIRENMRLGVTLEINRRLSELDARRYVRRRLYASLTYGS